MIVVQDVGRDFTSAIQPNLGNGQLHHSCFKPFRWPFQTTRLPSSTCHFGGIGSQFKHLIFNLLKDLDREAVIVIQYLDIILFVGLNPKQAAIVTTKAPWRQVSLYTIIQPPGKLAWVGTVN